MLLADEDGWTENAKDISLAIPGKEYTYYGDANDNIGIRNDGVEYVNGRDGMLLIQMCIIMNPVEITMPHRKKRTNRMERLVSLML